MIEVENKNNLENNIAFLLSDLKKFILEEIDNDNVLNKKKILVKYDNSKHESMSLNPVDNPQINFKKNNLVSLKIKENKNFLRKVFAGVLFTLKKDEKITFVIITVPKNLNSQLSENFNNYIERSIKRVLSQKNYNQIEYNIEYSKL